MSTPAIIIATVKLRPGMDAQFTAWKAHNDLVIGKFPGFVGSDIIPPTKPDSNEWTIILNFDPTRTSLSGRNPRNGRKSLPKGFRF